MIGPLIIGMLLCILIGYVLYAVGNLNGYKEGLKAAEIAAPTQKSNEYSRQAHLFEIGIICYAFEIKDREESTFIQYVKRLPPLLDSKGLIVKEWEIEIPTETSFRKITLHFTPSL